MEPGLDQIRINGEKVVARMRRRDSRGAPHQEARSEMALRTTALGGPTTAGVAERARERRQFILETSRRLFIRNGFHATGMAEIAADSGVKIGQIYRDFASKNEIITAIAVHDLSRFLNEVALEQAIVANDAAAIREWILGFVSYNEDIDGYRLMPEIVAESSRNREIGDLREKMNGLLRNALRTALNALAPGYDREQARSALADLILILASGFCLTIVVEAGRGRDCRLLSTRLRSIVLQELDLIQGG